MFSKLLANIQVGHSRHLTKRYVVEGEAWLLVLLVVVMALVYVFADVDSAYHTKFFIGIAIIAGIFLAIGMYHLEMRAYRKRPMELLMFADNNGLTYSKQALKDEKKPFEKVSLLHIHNVREPEFSNFLKGDGWEYSELSYKIYRKHKHGETHTETVYYGVMSMAMPRELPNMFFDSKKARGRQFRFEFDNDQLHQLEGDFNNYFATYFPNWYTIDGLAIITPDVMQALKDAADYDIELVGNRIFMYGPIYAVNRQLPDMLAKIQPIYKQLLDNILTYRDERLPYEKGRQMVTPLGATLKRSNFWQRVSFAILVIYVLLRYAAELIPDY